MIVTVVLLPFFYIIVLVRLILLLQHRGQLGSVPSFEVL